MSELSEKSKSVEGTESCGPECSCSCGTSSTGKKMKLAACLIVLLLVAGILIYKAYGTKNVSSGSAKESGFAITQAEPKSMPANNSDVLAVASEKQAATIAVTDTKQAAPVTDTIQISRKIGESLDSLSSLNKVALSQDTVFVFIPAAKSEFADDATKNAVIAAQHALKAKNINIGLYTLPGSSPDYAALSAQVQAPAILVATKGKGMAVVSGEVTETKLLQAYMASARSGGCGPSSSGCGPSSGGCN